MIAIPRRCTIQQLTRFAYEVVRDYYPELFSNYSFETFINCDDFGKGGFGSSALGLLRNREGSLLAILKGCTVTDEELPSLPWLIPACNLLSQLPLTRSSLILPFCARQYSKRGCHYNLLATKVAPGIPLSYHLASAVPQKRNREKLEAVACAIARAAEALAELHHLSSLRSLPISAHLIEIEDAVILYFLSLMEREPKRFPFSITAFQEHFLLLYRKAQVTPFQSGYIHGDSNITNVFYDKESDVLSFVDSMTLFHSINPQGAPCGNVASDYATCRFSIDLYARFYGYPEEERHAFDTLFRQNYCRNSGCAEPPAAHINFYTAYHWVAYAKIIDNLLYSKPHMRTTLYPLFDYTLQQLSKILSLE